MMVDGGAERAISGSLIDGILEDYVGGGINECCFEK